MLIKKPYTGTRLGLGDVDPVQPIDFQHPLVRGAEALYIPSPHLAGGSALYDLSANKTHLQGESAGWRLSANSSLPVYDVINRDLRRPDPGARFGGFARHIFFIAGGFGDVTENMFFGGKYNTADNKRSWLWRTDDSGSIRLSVNIGTSGGSEFEFLTNGPPKSVWGSARTIAFTFNEGVIGYYVDGKFDRFDSSTSQRTSFLSNDAPFVIGNTDTATPSANFSLHACAVYNLPAGGQDGLSSVIGGLHEQVVRGFPDLLNRRPSMTVVDMAVAPPDAVEADVTTTQAAQLTSADTLVYRTLDAATLQALQTVTASVTGIFDASASTRQQQQRAEAAAEIVGIISASTRQQPQRATADPQTTISVSVGTQQLPQRTTAAVGDLVRPRIQATSIRRAIDLQTSITRP